MSRRRLIILIVGIALLVAVAPGQVMARQSVDKSIDLSSVLASDGTFAGAAGASGSVDLSSWRLTSDLATGGAPRFARTNRSTPSAPTAQTTSADGTLWSGLGSNGAGNGAISGDVYAAAFSGGALYVGGDFVNAGGVATADYLARWDGSAWSGLGSNGAGNGALNDVVNAITVSGTNIYVGGFFTNAGGDPTADDVAVWNGSGWAGLGSNAGNGALTAPVNALAVWGNNIYVGGDFTNAGGVATADHVALWNGSAWSGLGSNASGDGAFNNNVFALVTVGSTVYAGGVFTNVGNNAPADYAAKWNGIGWEALGSWPGFPTQGALEAPVAALAMVGGNLYVGGSFFHAGGVVGADKVAIWNGSAWSGLAGNTLGNSSSWEVDALSSIGNNVYVGGLFNDAAGIAQADNLVRWDGANWSAVGSNSAGTDGALALDDQVSAIAMNGNALYVGGSFANAAADATADNIALAVVPGPWAAVGSTPPNGTVYAALVLGTDLYIGGSFTNLAGIATADYVARWNGTSWNALGSNGAGNGALNAAVRALAPAGGTVSVYVGGDFSNAAGIATADYLAKWNGTTWSGLGSFKGTDGALNGEVYAMTVMGADLYVGGNFTNTAGIATADWVSRWTGSAWAAMGSNGSGNGALSLQVFALASSNGSVYVGGQFLNAAGIAAADYIAKWTLAGNTWSALGSNGSGNGALNSRVAALAMSGSSLYVGGYFTNAGKLAAADFVARWTGSAWAAVGSVAAGGALNGPVVALAVAGSNVFAAGPFSNAGGVAAADNVARWTGSAWQALGSNGSGDGAVGGTTDALAADKRGVVLGGFFANVDGIPAADNLAIYQPLQADGMIRVGTGANVGNGVYNATGASQSRTGSAAPNGKITFSITVQDDGTAADAFKLKATGAATSQYQVRYFAGTTDITSAISAGTFQTPRLNPNGTFVITAVVTVSASASAKSNVTRLVTISSLQDPAVVDAVKFIGKRS